jgi:hypothetical protein
MKLLFILIIILKLYNITTINCSSNNETTKRTFISKSVSLNYIQIAINDTMRIEYLNQFLSTKIYQHNEKINLMLIPEIRYIYILKLTKLISYYFMYIFIINLNLDH